MKKLKTINQWAIVLFVGIMAQACASKQMAVEPVASKPAPVQMILDSDFGSSTDDLFALMMLHHYIDEGRVDLKGIVVDRNRY